MFLDVDHLLLQCIFVVTHISFKDLTKFWLKVCLIFGCILPFNFTFLMMILGLDCLSEGFVGPRFVSFLSVFCFLNGFC